MRCLYCGKEIGLWRAWRDREFCSRTHRRIGRVSSARAVRDSEVYASTDWEIHHSLTLSVAQEERKKAAPNLNPIIVVPLVVFGLLALEFLPQGSTPIKMTDYAPPGSRGGVLGSLKGALQGGSGVRLHSDFQTSALVDWIGPAGRAAGEAGSSSHSAGDWSFSSGSLRPGRLRLWKPSLPLADYRFEFQGQIENRALGWAFRASNVNNYYAAKLALAGSSTNPTGEIIRFAVLNGREGTPSEFPLPIPVNKGTSYHVRVAVKGDFFVTSINGRVVDTWRDARLRAGGVGFFADKGESATISWVSVTANDAGFFGKLFGAAFLVTPFDFDGDPDR